MSSDLTTYFGNKIARWVGGNAMPTAPTSLKIGLYNGNPKTSGVEVTDTIRAAGRVTAAFTVPAVGTDNTLVNSAEVDFGDSDGDVASLTHAALFDQAGNMLASKALTGGPFSVTSGSPVKYAVGNLSFAIGSAS